jgi:hypothetical protein
LAALMIWPVEPMRFGQFTPLRGIHRPPAGVIARTASAVVAPSFSQLDLQPVGHLGHGLLSLGTEQAVNPVEDQWMAAAVIEDRRLDFDGA